MGATTRGTGTMLVVGMAMLLPWNSFLNVLGLLSPAFAASKWSSTFAGAFSTTFLVFNFIVLAVETVKERYGYVLGDATFGTLLGASLTASVTFCLGFVVAAFYDKTATLYYLIIFCMFALGCFTAWLQGSAFRYAAAKDDSGKLTQAIMAGQAVAGVGSSLVMFVLVSGAFQPARTTLIYLIITACFVGSSVAIFAYSNRSTSRYGQVIQEDTPVETPRVEQLEPVQTSIADATAPEPFEIDQISLDMHTQDQENTIKAHASFRNGFYCAVSVFLCFTCSLGIFPGLTIHLLPKHFSANYFQPMLVFAFNVGDLLGRLLKPSRCVQNPFLQCIYGMSRFLIFPVILTCGMDDASKMPHFFVGDGWPILWIFLLGITNGHLATASMMVGCKLYSPTAMSLWLNAGLAAGSILSTGVAALVF